MTELGAILTSARIGSLGPGRFPYSHCGWTPMRPELEAWTGEITYSLVGIEERNQFKSLSVRVILLLA
jgi:hypothetical protein